MISLIKESLLERISSVFSEPEFPADLIIVVMWLLASVATIYLPFLNATPLRYVLTIPVVLFIPGYCLVAALFPKEGGIDLFERIALSFGLSIAIVPLIGLGLNFTPWGIRLDPIVISLIVFTLSSILVAYYRRVQLPFEERFKLPYHSIGRRIRQGVLTIGESKIDRFISVGLILSIFIAVLIASYVIVFPKEGERFSEFYLLGEKRMADDYPNQIITGSNYPIYIGVGNHEYHNITYTVEIWTTHLEFDNETNMSHIILMDPADQISLTLAHNETSIVPYNLSVKKTEYNRVEFLLFNETVPGSDIKGSDRINASYRDLNLWITVR